MAVARRQAFAKDALPKLKRTATGLITLGQLLFIAGTGALLYFTNIFHVYPEIAVAILLLQAIFGTIIAIAAYHITAQPLKDLMAAIIHTSGEPSAQTPPNPNDSRFAKNGFRDALQMIYALASKAPDTSQKAPAQNATDGTSNPVVAPAQTHSLIEAALNETSCGFVVMNQQRVITFANKAAPVNINQAGASQLSLIFNGNDTLDAWLDECAKTAVHAEHTWVRIPNKLPEEENRRFFDVIASYDKGAESEVVLTLVDRTDQYSAGEQELDFIAFAAHELRGPITVIRGYLDVLQDELKDVLQDDQSELFRRLTVSANRLSGYINNILNTSRYDRRHLKMHLAEASLADIYDTIRDDMNLRASAQNRLLSVEIPADLPHIAADTASLGEVIGNLIDNAIKYSNEGGAINVTTAAKGDLVELSVQDHGIGMPGNVVSNLFQKFYRSHRSRETVAGTGIGLYISKAIVESHGGTINVSSEEGRGSTFTISLPTYQSVADKLKAGDNTNEGMIDHQNGWINNHSMFRG